ncbi:MULTISPECIES: beta-ketoacyl-ACP synthase III [Amycolatopsis]|uniref:Beta-ketoacyl-[acyl-carrier-protein] synthase III n=1 Tax=Amycolatopsis albidoflavus TaxID=102226 RepID=A0ABW5HS91_9PSEU
MTSAAVLAGVGAWVPPKVVTNQELAARFGVTDEWIRRRTGIAQRHVASRGTATSDLAVEAGRRALESSGIGAVGCVVLATATPDHPVPATAPAVADRLGLPGVPAFDLHAVCTGFLYGMAVASSMIKGGAAESVLLIGADTFSTILDPADPSTFPLFGDGAGAVVLRAGNRSEDGAVGEFVLGSDGSGADLIMVPGGGARQRSEPDAPAWSAQHFTMHGKKVFTKAVTRMAEASAQVLRAAGIEPAQVDRIVGHQANIRILHTLASQLDVPAERLAVNIDRVGNTSAASIPLAMADAAADESLSSGDRVLVTAFGGGLTWGAGLLSWPKVSVLAPR